jgi:hypothetical protein
MLFCAAWFFVVLLAYVFVEDVRKGANDIVLSFFQTP